MVDKLLIKKLIYRIFTCALLVDWTVLMHAINMYLGLDKPYNKVWPFAIVRFEQNSRKLFQEVIYLSVRAGINQRKNFFKVVFLLHWVAEYFSGTLSYFAERNSFYDIYRIITIATGWEWQFDFMTLHILYSDQDRELGSGLGHERHISGCLGCILFVLSRI